MRLSLLFLTLFFSLPSFSEELSEEDIEELKSSVVVIEAYYKELPYERTLGSGVLIFPTEVATAYHVVEDTPDLIVVTFNQGEENEKSVEAFLDKEQDYIDVAILKLESKVDIPYLELGSVRDFNLEAKTPLIALRYSEEQIEISPGHISHVENIKDLIYEYNTTIEASNGWSGAPVISPDRKVLGILNSIDKKDGTANASLIDYVQILRGEETIEDIEQVLVDKEVPQAWTNRGELALFNSSYKEAFFYIQKASNLGDILAKAYLMIFYEYGMPELYSSFSVTDESWQEFLSSPGELIHRDKKRAHQLREEVLEGANEVELLKVLLFLTLALKSHTHVSSFSKRIGEIITGDLRSSKIIDAIFYENGLEVEVDVTQAKKLYREFLEEFFELENQDVPWPQNFAEFRAFVEDSDLIINKDESYENLKYFLDFLPRFFNQE